MSSNKIDYYTILDVSRSATVQQIKKAYKKLAIKWHPDKNPDNKDQAVQKFRQISQAYQVLSNEQKRKKYDLYGFDGAKLSSGSSSTRYNFNDANDLFKSFFSSYGFDNTSDSSFFDAYLKAFAKAARGGSTTSTGGTSYYTYSSKPTGGTSYTSYSSRPTPDATSAAYASYYNAYGKKPTTSTSSSSNSYGYSNAYSYPSGSTYFTNQSTQQTSSPTKQDEQLPPEGQTIKKVHHVTRKFTNGTQQTIQRTTIISSDGSKQIIQQNLDGTNKKTHYVLGGGKKTTTQNKANQSSPPKSANFSGYNFGKRQSTTTTTQSSPTQQKQTKTTNIDGNTKTTYTYYTNSTGSGLGSGYSGYSGYSGTSGTSGASTSYKIPSDMYANIKRTYSGGTKVYYADGTQAPNDGSSFGQSYNYNTGDTKTKVYYTVRR